MQTLVLEGRDLTQELHTLIQALDPARAAIDANVRRRFEEFNTRLSDLLARVEAVDGSEHLAALHARLAEICRILQEHLDQHSQNGWAELRTRLAPAYEAVAASLKVERIHVPSLRPTNWRRSIFHVASGIIVMFLLQHTLPLGELMWVALGFMGAAWFLEITRRFSERWNRMVMLPFCGMAHPHEVYRVNSATWYVTALFVCTLFATPLTGALAVIVLGISDPVAALVGRRYGRHVLVAGRTVAGTSAFAVSAFLASLLVLAIYEPQLYPWTALLLAGSAAVIGAIVELVSERVDDNFSIPVSVGLGTAAIAWVVGL
jgi:dolichol kinase